MYIFWVTKFGGGGDLIACYSIAERKILKSTTIPGYSWQERTHLDLKEGRCEDEGAWRPWRGKKGIGEQRVLAGFLNPYDWERGSISVRLTIGCETVTDQRIIEFNCGFVSCKEGHRTCKLCLWSLAKRQVCFLFPLRGKIAEELFDPHPDHPNRWLTCRVSLQPFHSGTYCY